MRQCQDENLFLAKGTFKGYVAILIASINRSAYQYVSDWKKFHIDEICNGSSIPQKINIPQNWYWNWSCGVMLKKCMMIYATS